MEFIWIPLINILVVFYHLFFGNLGIAVIAFTGFLSLLMAPLTIPMMQVSAKMKQYGPELARLKKKYSKDKKKLMQAQADFYRAKGINPAAGCLPQIIKIIVLLALFHGFMSVFGVTNGNVTTRLNEILYPPLHISGEVNKTFLNRDLTQPDIYNIEGLPIPLPGFFLILAAVLQFLGSKMMMPAAKRAEKIAKKTKGEIDDLASSMQEQMLFLFPLLTILIGFNFPLALVLYWGSLSFFQIVQQYFVGGWGGLSSFLKKVKLVK